jgi:Mg2+ and Co2+ transporter CorA
MELKVFLLNNQKHLEKSSPSTFFRTDPSSHNGQPLFWIDCAKPDPVSLSEFFSPLNLHPLVLEGCLDPATGVSIAPFEQSLFIKIPLHLSWDSFISTFLIIVVLPYAVITVHETPIPILERMEREFSSATRFRVVGPSAILYQMLDHVIDEDMVFALEARRAIDALEETMDQEEDAVEIDEILILKRRVSRLTATIEDQRYCITSLQTVESDAFELGESREYFRDLLAHLESTVRSLGETANPSGRTAPTPLAHPSRQDQQPVEGVDHTPPECFCR